MGPVESYTQNDIEAYFAELRRKEKERPPEKRESKAMQDQRIAALKYYIIDCLGLRLNFKDVKTKGLR